MTNKLRLCQQWSFQQLHRGSPHTGSRNSLEGLPFQRMQEGFNPTKFHSLLHLASSRREDVGFFGFPTPIRSFNSASFVSYVRPRANPGPGAPSCKTAVAARFGFSPGLKTQKAAGLAHDAVDGISSASPLASYTTTIPWVFVHKVMQDLYHQQTHPLP